jgi:hypothetical protein
VTQPLATLAQVLEVEAPPIYLRHADYSFNNIRALRDLSAFCFLRELQLDNNQLTALTGMQSLKALRVLSLKNNQLEHIGGLQHLRLHTLCISNNRVYLSVLYHGSNNNNLCLSNNQV